MENMKKTLGTMIAELRKQHGMTQLELAEKMGVTDKAVSKWERDLSCPDINSLPTLAEILGVSVEELMQIKKEAEAPVSKVSEIVEIAPKAVAMAMGVAVTVLTVLNALDVKSGMIMLGIGLAGAGIALMREKK
jgi:transcriptional regulator with XRE-family HTH domain